MELKGDVKRGGLPSLFRNFATENFTGVLTITSSVGEKLITLTENEITIYCDELNEASRLGNILLAREKVTLEALEGALKDQKKIEPRPWLGDMLIRRGLATQQDCIDARRFQIEEDIGDILSWKNARFHFAGQESGREIHPEDFAPEQVHRLTIDPESFFKSITKFSDDWETIGDRLPTQYLCFKVSAKAEESISRLNKNAVKVLRYLSEGKTIEGAVRHSCLGRIETCVNVIELLEMGLILPASGADLRFQASEHRAQKKYHDALYIYRRLLESPDTKDERQYIENLIAEISMQIIAQKQAGGYGEEAVVISHRVAKEKFQRSKSLKSVLTIAAVLAIVIALAVFWVQSQRISDDLPQRYRIAIAQADMVAEKRDFKQAAQILQIFYDSIEDKDSQVARDVQEQMLGLSARIDRDIRERVVELETGLSGDNDSLKKTVAALQKLKDEHPNNSSSKKIDGLLAQGEAKLKETDSVIKPANEVKEIPRSQLVEQLAKALQLQQELKFAAAERGFEELIRQAPAADTIWKQADEALKVLQSIKLRARDEFEKARDEVKANQGEKALALLSKLKTDYPDLEVTGQATALEIKLQTRKRQAQELMNKAREEEQLGRIYPAITSLLMLLDSYPEFQITVEARRKKEELETKGDEVRKELMSALEAVTASDYKTARAVFKKLLDKNYQLLVDQKVDLPVFVNSIPPGSVLKLNGENAGLTPQNVLIAAGKPFELIIERPGFKSFRIAKSNITSQDLEIAVQLTLDPIVIEMGAPLYAPAVSLIDKPLLLAGPALYGLNPPAREPLWSLPGLFNDKETIPDSQNVAIGEERRFWNLRLPPRPFTAGKMLLPLRNKDLLELDFSNPAAPVKSLLLRSLPAEITGKIYIDEHSRLAGKALMVAAFTDGQIRCYEDIDRAKGRAPRELWSLPMDAIGNLGRDGPVAGVHMCDRLAHVLSPNGTLSAMDPVEGRIAWRQTFDVMSVRSTFGEKPGDNLAALVLRDGKVLIVDLKNPDRRTDRPAIWELPKRMAMQESVGALVTDIGIFITTTNNEAGTLHLYQRTPVDGKGKELWSASIQGHVDLEMARGKHLCVVTHLNRVLAYDIKTGRQRWEYKMDADLGKPLWIRAIGEYVYVGTLTGKLLILKAD